MKLNKDWREFIDSFNANGVEYLIVGAFAVAWHGYPRFTADIDFLVRPQISNAERVLKALRDFGFGSLDVQVEDLCRPNHILQLGVKPNRIDIITSIAGVTFEDAWASRVTGSIEGLPVFFIGIDEMILTKETTGRLQDAADAQALRLRKPSVY
jgi:hypothetical protein